MWGSLPGRTDCGTDGQVPHLHLCPCRLVCRWFWRTERGGGVWLVGWFDELLLAAEVSRGVAGSLTRCCTPDANGEEPKCLNQFLPN